MRRPRLSAAGLLRSARHALTHNFGLKLLSLASAFGLWYFVNTERTVEKPLRVPVQLQNIPPTLTVTEHAADYVDVRVVGPSALVTRAEKQVGLFLDLTGVRPGRATFTMEPELFALPRGVRVVRVTPSEVSVTLEQLVAGQVPVRAQVTGAVPTGYVLRGIEVTPADVQLRGPESVVGGLAAVETSAIDVSGSRGTHDRVVTLVVPDLVIPSVSQVTATVRIDEVVVVREVTGIPVEVANVATGYTLSPTTIALTLRGPERVLTELTLPPGAVKVNGDGARAGTHTVTATVTLPERVELVAQKPKTFQLTIREPAAQ